MHTESCSLSLSRDNDQRLGTMEGDNNNNDDDDDDDDDGDNDGAAMFRAKRVMCCLGYVGAALTAARRNATFRCEVCEFERLSSDSSFHKGIVDGFSKRCYPAHLTFKTVQHTWACND